MIRQSYDYKRLFGKIRLVGINDFCSTKLLYFNPGEKNSLMHACSRNLKDIEVGKKIKN